MLGAVPTWKFTGTEVLAEIGPPLHTAVKTFGPGGNELVVRVDVPTFVPNVSTTSVPRGVPFARNSTWPLVLALMLEAGKTEASRVTGVPGAAEPLGLVVNVTPETSTSLKTEG